MTKLILLVAVCLFLDTAAFAKKPHKASFKKKKHTHSFALGLKRDKEKLKAFKKAKASALKKALMDVAIPGQFDLTAKVSPPENQLQCGDCWNFAIVKALRSQLMLAGRDPGRLAFNYLKNNCSGVPAAQEMGCNGGDFPAGEGVINGLGPWLESQDPYQPVDGSCMQGLPTAGTGLTWNVVGDGVNVPSFKDRAQAIAAGHVLVIDLAAVGDFMDYQSGIFDSNQAGPNQINHMINEVGYNCETSVDANGNCAFDANGQPVNGDGYFIEMNNWGTTDWGMAGYMWARYGVDALANTAMYFDVAQGPAPAPSPQPAPVPNPQPQPEPAPVPQPEPAPECRWWQIFCRRG